MRLKIAILAGDGIGPEVTNEAVNILKAVAEFGGHDFTFVPLLVGGVAIDATGSALPPDKRPEAGLLQIRQALGGFANLRPSIAYPALSANSPLRPEVTEGADILFVRELLGGLYFGSPRWWHR